MNAPAALVLAGGLGTRLRSAVPDRPKVLAPIDGVPFLDLLLASLQARGVRRIVLLVGAMHDQVERHVRDGLPSALRALDVVFSREETPLGTAGALRNAAAFFDRTCLLVNGDTYFDLDLPALLRGHATAGTTVTIAATRVDDTSRYGALDLAADGRVVGFREKAAASGAGVINAGVYLMEPALLARIPAGRAVSLEAEILPALVAERAVSAVVGEGAFFDIGTPDSYAAFARFVRQRPSLELPT